MAGFIHRMLTHGGAVLAGCCMAATLASGAPPGRAAPGGAATTHGNRLDLRLPAHDFASLGGNRPSIMRMGAARSGNGEDTPPRASAWMGSNAKPMSRIEAFARQVHREGLPLARLWENQSALVSLGLNPRGKPGLWLVQKTH